MNELTHRTIEANGIRVRGYISVVLGCLYQGEVKPAAVAEVAAALGASVTARNTALLLVDRRRARALPYIADTLRELADVRKGVVRAQVTSATPLSDSYYARLQGQLERLTGMRVVVERQTDASLIGGVVTRIGDRIFDGSVRSRLQSMREALLPTV